MTEEEQIVVKVGKGENGYYVKKLDISKIPDDDALWDFIDENNAFLLSPDWKEGFIVEHKYNGNDLWQFFPDWEMIEEEYEDVLVNALKNAGIMIDDEGCVVKLFVVKL